MTKKNSDREQRTIICGGSPVGGNAVGVKRKEEKRCDNCGDKSTLACAKCNRNICEGCYHCGNLGKSCGLCVDRESGYRRWQKAGAPGDFDEWYDGNA